MKNLEKLRSDAGYLRLKSKRVIQESLELMKRIRELENENMSNMH